MSLGFLFSDSLSAYRTPSQDAFPLVAFSLARGKKGRPEGFSLFSTSHIRRLRGSFFSMYSWRA